MVSIIIPVFNSANLLNRCVESIFAQTFKDFEVILVDDGSTDNSLKICTEISKKDKRVKVFHKDNGGASSARNVGLKNAKGDFVAFVDSDDTIESNMLEKMLSKQSEKDADVVICNIFKVFGEQKFKVLEPGVKTFCENRDISMLLRHENLKKIDEKTFQTLNNVNCYLMRFLFKKSAVKDLFFDEELYNYLEDVRFLTELFLRDLKIDFLDECLYNYYISENSLSHGGIKNIVKKTTKFLMSITPLLEQKNLNELASAEKFYVYYMCVANNLKTNSNDDLSEVKKYNTYENYKNHKILCNGKASKLKAFLIHYHLTFILKIALKLGGKRWKNQRLPSLWRLIMVKNMWGNKLIRF